MCLTCAMVEFWSLTEEETGSSPFTVIFTKSVKYLGKNSIGSCHTDRSSSWLSWKNSPKALYIVACALQAMYVFFLILIIYITCFRIWNNIRHIPLNCDINIFLFWFKKKNKFFLLQLKTICIIFTDNNNMSSANNSRSHPPTGLRFTTLQLILVIILHYKAMLSMCVWDNGTLVTQSSEVSTGGFFWDPWCRKNAAGAGSNIVSEQ